MSASSTISSAEEAAAFVRLVETTCRDTSTVVVCAESTSVGAVSTTGFERRGRGEREREDAESEVDAMNGMRVNGRRSRLSDVIELLCRRIALVLYTCAGRKI